MSTPNYNDIIRSYGTGWMYCPPWPVGSIDLTGYNPLDIQPSAGHVIPVAKQRTN
jgi:hypothetical protein